MASAAGALVAKARQDVISHFMSANAVSPESAVPFASKRWIERRQFDRFVAAGVLRPSSEGGHYLDVPAWDAYSKSRRRRAGMLIGALAVAAGAAVALLG